MKFLCTLTNLLSLLLISANAQEVDFDPIEWADTRMVQVQFQDNPQNDKAFLLTPPPGWVSIKDITKLFNTELLKKMNKSQVLTRMQSVYPYIVIAKSLDAVAWQLDPYNFKVPMSDLQFYAKDFLLDQYAVYKNIDRKVTKDENLYEQLVAEVADQEFSLKVTWPWCESASMKRACAAIKSRKMAFELTDITLDFDTMPKTLNDFKQSIIPQLTQWHASNRRLYVVRTILSVIEAKQAKNNNEFKIKKLGEKDLPQKDSSSEFFNFLWGKVPVLTYANYCDFPTLICNRFEADKFKIPVTNQNIEILLSIKLSDEE